MRVITRKTENIHPKCGEANGYLVISDKTHPWFGETSDFSKIKCHGGITYSKQITKEAVDFFDQLTIKDVGSWMLGFDTSHLGDNKKNWPVKKVLEEATNWLLEPAKKLTQKT